jgi:UDP-N-acetylmuramate: L-alanyl-gamma-D-glutamyl-meso-diaminopimelate ligase
MKLGSAKAQLPWALEACDLAFCHRGSVDWDPSQALAPMGGRAVVVPSVDDLVRRIAGLARPGDHVLCMSNGSFGGAPGKIVAALRDRESPAPRKAA